jgi:hypothetical protein
VCNGTIEKLWVGELGKQGAGQIAGYTRHYYTVVFGQMPHRQNMLPGCLSSYYQRNDVVMLPIAL